MESIRMIINKLKDGSIKQMWEEFKWMFSYGKNYKKEKRRNGGRRPSTPQAFEKA